MVADARTSVIANYKTKLLPTFGVLPQWTGDNATCSPGDTAPAFKQATLQAVNYFRDLASLPPVVLVDAQSAIAQQVALVMSASGKLSHFPDDTFKCLNDTSVKGADQSLLAQGFAGANAISAYMQDVGHYDQGHRRWLLYASLLEVGTGDTNDYNALYIMGKTASSPPGTAGTLGTPWPPRGYLPWSDKVAVPTDIWSFSFEGADFTGATVEMFNDLGQPLAIDVTSKTLAKKAKPTDPDVYISLGSQAPINGLAAFTWQMTSAASNWSRLPADTKFTVKINNVRVGNAVKNFSYDVIFVQPL